jgi:hypothetical protein
MLEPEWIVLGIILALALPVPRPPFHRTYIRRR